MEGGDVEVTEDRYTMPIGEAQAILKLSREGLHKAAERGDISYKLKPHGSQQRKFFDPAEVERYARLRAGQETA